MPGRPSFDPPSRAEPLDQLRLLVEAQTDYAIFLLDTQGRVTTWNPGAQRIKGYEADAIVGRHFSCFYTPEDIERAHPGVELAVARRVGRYEEEGWRVRKDGTHFWAQVVITALRDEEGELVGYGKVTRDLSERRAAEEELRAAAEELARSEARALAEAERMRRRTSALEDMGRAIVASSELAEMVQLATDAATDLTGAAFGAFFYNVFDDQGGSYTLYTTSGVEREAFSRFPMPRQTAIFAPTFSGEAVLRSDDITQDSRYGRSFPHHGMPPGHLPVRSYLAVPVTTTDGEVAGAMLFGHPQIGVFNEDAEDAAVSLAASAAVALVNARLLDEARRDSRARQTALQERDRVAQVLQQSLLPPALPEIAGLDLGSHYQPGRELVGGDFYDVFALGEDRWGIVLGDVCGVGPEAAAQTALTRHSVRTAAMFAADPGHVLDVLNTALLRSDSDRFATAVFARIDPREGDVVKMCLASGGHPPVILCRADGTVTQCRISGPLLGVFDTIRLETTQLELRPNDTLVLYTDGLVEARRDGETFGFQRLGEAVAALRDRPAGEIAPALAAAAAQFAGAPLHDDIAIIVVRVTQT